MSQKLLLVDDDDSHRLLARRALKDVVVTILEARTVAEASATLKSSLPDLALVILDMNLSGVSSLSLLEELRRAASIDKLPVVVLSTSALEKDVTAAYRAGASCYLLKSIDPNEYRIALAKAAQFFLSLR